MESDIKLQDGGLVEIEGNVLKVSTHDILLDHPDRRSESGGRRRALVHDFDDGLTLNWRNDYPGGVTVKGNLKAERASFSNEVEFGAIVNINQRLIVGEDSVLYVSGRSEFTNSPTVPDLQITELGTEREVELGGPGTGNVGTGLNPGIGIGRRRGRRITVTEPASLVEIIQELREEIKSLKDRVSELERDA